MHFRPVRRSHVGGHGLPHPRKILPPVHLAQTRKFVSERKSQMYSRRNVRTLNTALTQWHALSCHLVLDRAFGALTSRQAGLGAGTHAVGVDARIRTGTAAKLKYFSACASCREWVERDSYTRARKILMNWSGASSAVRQV